MQEQLIDSQIEAKLGSFQELPVLFIGSGFSRRYLGFPDWSSLLEHFARQCNHDNPLAYARYSRQVEIEGSKENLLPRIATLIENDFNRQWYETANSKNLKQNLVQFVKNGGSPFKWFVADFFKKDKFESQDQLLQDELAIFARLANRSIASVITTNYDGLIEHYLSDYKKFVGQEELIFSTVHGVHEIYKIHGCCSQPESIVINENDYIEFGNKKAYLAAKLLTLFVEQPVVFIGYSLQDDNIRNILSEIVNCIDNEKLAILKNRLVFIEWNHGHSEKNEISSHTINFSNTKVLHMTKITVSDYKAVFAGLAKIRSQYDLKILRKLKNDVYEVVTHNRPVEEYRTINLDGESSSDPKTVAGVTLNNSGQSIFIPTPSELYRDIVLDNGGYNPDNLIDQCFELLLKHNSGSLPGYKYISSYSGTLPAYLRDFKAGHIDHFFSKTLRNQRARQPITWNDFLQLMKSESVRAFARFHLIKPEEIKALELKKVLVEIFNQDPDIFEHLEKPHEKTDLKRAIKVLDWLLYGKEKTA
ncbi:MAG: hypothetical protein A2W80_16730 [Candidatus Riflebacteria bacterium GWC2_50_8]|nr:MAG: hypothetical protein A2W80_16730 [Candidatus Riflebacteria bacterium GWC2_50_8]